MRRMSLNWCAASSSTIRATPGNLAGLPRAVRRANGSMTLSSTAWTISEPYEDAISSRSVTVFHSVLSPCLNIGLLTPRELIDAALARIDDTPLQSLEGFIRQVIGWREFVRGRLPAIQRAARRQQLLATRTRNVTKLARRHDGYSAA